MADGVPIAFRKGGEALEEPIDLDRSLMPIFRSGSGEEKESKFLIPSGNLPVMFRSGPAGNYSLDWYDLSTGAGYKLFYGSKIINAATTYKYTLNNHAMHAFIESTTSASCTRVNAGVALDIDFDISFAQPTVLQGDAFIQIPVDAMSNNAAAYTQTWTISLYKVAVGGAETQLGSSVVHDSPITKTDPIVLYAVLAGTIVIPFTKILVGEKVRLNVSTPAPPTGTTQATLWHDPLNYPVDAGPYSPNMTSQLELNLPFKVDK